MTSPKNNKKGTTSWVQCDNCQANILQNSKDFHFKDCPPSLVNVNSNFVLNGTLYGTLDIKVNEDIKGVTSHECNNLVFLSQSVIQLCNLSIGEYAIVSNGIISSAHRVWPTAEKSLTSVLFTKIGLELTFGKQCKVTVSKVTTTKAACRIIVIALNKIEITSNLMNRLHKLHLDRLLMVGNKISLLYFGRLLYFKVQLIQCFQLETNLQTLMEECNIDVSFYGVTENTSWSIFSNEAAYKNEVNKVNPFYKIGGLDEEIIEIREIISAALGKSKVLSRSIISRGILLYGSPGTGKTLLLNAFVQEYSIHTISINKLNANEEINNLTENALKHSPTLITIDEIDTICMCRSARLGDYEKKVMTNLLHLFDRINEVKESRVFVLATSNKPDLIDSSFRQCGRLDREIEISIPNPKSRLSILRKLLLNVPHNLNEDQFKKIANAAHGFVGTDLVALCSRAALNCAKREDNELQCKDLDFALTRVHPSAMREVQVEVPNIKWTDIGGQHDLKLILRQAVEWPLKYRESFVRLGITPPRGVLMFGPPGCSKTMIAKALATESGLNFLSIKGPELFSKWVGESERAVREVFRKARQVAPSVIFFDEIDALGGERTSGSSTSVQERVLAQLLTELDGVTPLGDVTVLAATNRPDRIDRALLRPGRLDRIVYVPLPDSHTRKDIFKIKMNKMPVSDVEIDELVESTEGYSGAEVNAICHEAAMKALEENIHSKEVKMCHFLKALQIVSPRTPTSLLNIYTEYIKH
ncbi:hypothetical protein FQA39_LY18642 [Lamprigera yunnana]|nr:hypothetical protein FQA39_LY18642 [Lamprigera yunnana]